MTSTRRNHEFADRTREMLLIITPAKTHFQLPGCLQRLQVIALLRLFAIKCFQNATKSRADRDAEEQRIG